MKETPYGSPVPQKESPWKNPIVVIVLAALAVAGLALFKFKHETPASMTQVGSPDVQIVEVEKPTIVEKPGDPIIVERVVEKPVTVEKIIEKPVIIEREVEVEVEVEIPVEPDPKEKWGRKGEIRRPTDRDVYELLSAGYVVEDYYRRQFKLDNNGDLWTRPPKQREWKRKTIHDPGCVTYKGSDRNYPLLYWEEARP